MRTRIVKYASIAAFATVAVLASSAGPATGLATCDAGPQETWQSQSKLEELLTKKGWTVRRIKIDGGCYEVYALNEKGERVEAYFHPKTLEPVPTK
ncbi:MAG: PepSY domain-containing protein [Steroidobacteraceae bacterium]